MPTIIPMFNAASLSAASLDSYSWSNTPPPLAVIQVDKVHYIGTISNIMDDASNINIRVAAQVRSLRTAQGLSLDDLAQKSGVSRSMLSVIERAESSPTAVVLDKVAAGLGVPLATLFDDTTAAVSPLSRSGERTPWRDPTSGYIRRNLSPPHFASPIQLVEIILPAGAHVTYESVRQTNLHQQVWVQDGAIEISVGKETYELRKDDCLAMKLSSPTSFRNRSKKDAKYIVVISSTLGHLP